jgi:hypothetical protein
LVLRILIIAMNIGKTFALFVIAGATTITTATTITAIPTPQGIHSPRFQVSFAKLS